MQVAGDDNSLEVVLSYILIILKNLIRFFFVFFLIQRSI